MVQAARMGWFSIFFDKRLTLVNNPVFDYERNYREVISNVKWIIDNEFQVVELHSQLSILHYTLISISHTCIIGTRVRCTFECAIWA